MKAYSTIAVSIWMVALSAACETVETPSEGTGGSAARGGSSATGGSVAAGGSATGGRTTGGRATGGVATGGNGSGGGTSANVTVWLAGDSTVQPCSSSCPCGWGSQFAPYFDPRVTVKNNAVGGRSIQTWMYEPNVSTTMGTDGECVVTETNSSRWAATIAGMKAGDYLFIQFGINDGSSTCDRHVGLTRFQTLLGRMATEAKAKGAQPVFVTPVSAISCSGSTAQPTRGAYVTATITAGGTYGVPVIDLHQLSINLYNKLGFCPNNGDYTAGAVGAFFCDDHTHFEAAGAVQIAALVANALRTQSLPLAAYLL